MNVSEYVYVCMYVKEREKKRGREGESEKGTVVILNCNR